jgi:hypothetical protein
MTFQRTLIALSLFAAGAAFAQTADPAPHTPRIDQREARQEQRIQQGAASGSLTEKEAARLGKGQAHVDHMQGKAEADGKVTRRERARIHHAQNKQDRHIKRQKHDRQTTAPAS